MALLVAASAGAQQVDIHGQAASAFGTAVAVLPNGNIVVTAPNFTAGANMHVGAVYLYGPSGNLIKAFTGSTTNDQVGNGGITVLKNGNFVVASPAWNGGYGAATWFNGATGLADNVVTATNSLIGTSGDQIGSLGVVALSNGNYIVRSPHWNAERGAVTWGNGSTGVKGAVSAANSLIGSAPLEGLGNFGVTALSNGNAVVLSPSWNGYRGAAAWINGSTGKSVGATLGVLSSSNSLVGTSASDFVSYGGVTALSNGNYVVASPAWQGEFGAATWVNGGSGLPVGGLATGVAAANSLVGDKAGDRVGSGGTVALSNGNYVVSSYEWGSAVDVNATKVGAATWGNGATGLANAAVSATNSLIGTAKDDSVGTIITALSNGNYVVGSPYWDGVDVNVGAATWGNGSTASKGVKGAVTALNSLTGTTAGDEVSYGGITALSNGNYVVASWYWNNGTPLTALGAATWGNGATGLSNAVVSTSNSLYGSSASDAVGGNGAVALSNGNYVVVSSSWNHVGAVTWADGTKKTAAAVGIGNSLVGSVGDGDFVGGGGVVAIGNGNYAVSSPGWSDGFNLSVGAVTWGDGRQGLAGNVTPANSLIGGMSSDSVGNGNSVPHRPGLTAVGAGHYVVLSSAYSESASNGGAVSLGRGSGGTVGLANSRNSVRGTFAGGGSDLVFGYDPGRDSLVVGQPDADVVSLFRADLLFKNGFE